MTLARWRARLTSRTARMIAAAMAALLATYSLVGFLLLPWLIERYAPRIASEQLQRTVTLGKVRFNPWNFKLHVEDLALAEPDGESLVRLGLAFVDFELSGLWHRAFAFQEIRLEKLRLNPKIGRDGRLNFARIADAFPPSEQPEPPPEEDALPRLMIDHFALVDSAIEYTDESKDPVVSERMDAINLRLESISTLPDNQASHHFAATFEDGSAVDWHGQASLNPIASQGHFRLAGFKLATPWPFVKDRIALQEPGGELALAAAYQFAQDGDAIELGLTEIAATLSGLKLRPLDGKEPLLELDQLQLSGGSLSLAEQSLKIPEFALRKGRLKASVDERGMLDWQRVVKSAPVAPAAPSPPAASAPPAAPAQPWHVAIDAFRIEDLALQFSDASRQLPLDASIGKFGLGFKLAAEAGAGDPKVTIGDLDSEIRNIGIKPLGGKDALLALETFQISDGAVDLGARTLKLPSIAIKKGLVQAEVDRQGRVNWQQLADTATHSATPQPSAAAAPVSAKSDRPARKGKGGKAARPTKKQRTAAKPASTPQSEPAAAQHAAAAWRIDVDALKIEQIGLHYADDSRRSPIAIDVGNFGLGLRAAIESGAGDPKVLVEALQSELKQISLHEHHRAKPLASLESLVLGGGRIDLAENLIGIQQIALVGGATAVERDEKGSIRLLEVFAPRDQGKAIETVKQADASAKREGKPWHLAVDRVDLTGFQASFNDRSVAPPFTIAVRPAELHLAKVANFGKSPLTFDGRIHVVQGGDLSLKGHAMPTAEHGQAELRLERLSLAGLQPYVAQVGALKLDSGDLSTHLIIVFQQKRGQSSVTAKGDATSKDLMLREARSGDPFAAWEKLAVNGIDFSLAPDRLAIKEVNAYKPVAKLAIFKDRTTNIDAIFSAPSKARPSQARKPAQPAKPAKPAGGKSTPFPVSVQRVKVEQAIVDFSDESLVLPFKTRIQNFGGTISGIATKPSARTLIKLDGRVDEYGEANLEGTLDLMQHKAFSDISLIFRNVEMSSLSPYSGTFAGRRIQAGKLNAELKYKIEDSHLKSQAKIELYRFALGSEVESPRAKSLPLDLAVALLTDRTGKIAVSVPIEGNVDDPQFAYGSVIWDALATLITKVVTAPFTALAGVFGSGDEAVDSIFFIPGKSGLPPAEIEKLKTLAAGLKTRPNVALKVTGTFDPKLDAEALKSWKVRTVVSEKLGLEVPSGEDPGPIAFDNAQSQKALEDLAAAPGNGNTVASALTAFQEKFGRAPQRIGALTALMDKAAEDTEFYRMLFDRLVETTPLESNALASLADRRVNSIVKELAVAHRIDRSRLRAQKPDATEEKEGRIPSHLDLTVDGR